MALHDGGTGNQSGDHTSRDAAGRDITHVNNPEPWLAFVRGYLHDLDQQRTRRDDELAAELVAAHAAMRRLADELDLYQATIASRARALAEQAQTTRLLAVGALAVAALALALAVLL